MDDKKYVKHVKILLQCPILPHPAASRIGNCIVFEVHKHAGQTAEVIL